MSFRGKVLVAGATGRTGLWVIRRLQHYGITTRAFARKADKLAEFRDLEVELGRLQNELAVQRCVRGCDAVICAVGATSLFGESSPVQVDGDGTIRLIDAAANAGVRHFILISSIATTKPFHPLNLYGGILSQKRRAERHLEQVFSSDGRTFTIIRPGGLKDGEPLKHKLQLDIGDRITGVIDRSDVAELAVLSLTHPKAKNCTFEAIRLSAEEQASLVPFLDALPSRATAPAAVEPVPTPQV
ncbi:MAG: SDR family oxidoreductase [Chloroherpetonaceae bacterium]|nr:SDR family oxidoreductase [Chloroherpetonaceae bacterium]